MTAANAAAYWVPPQHLTWYWQLTGTPKVEPVQATDMDGFDNSAATVASFHALGQRAICYIDVGTAENWRSDYSQFPPADLGLSNGWPGEQWLNITDQAIRPIMDARFAMCAQKGFDAVEPDNMDGYENTTGFTISAAQQLAYDEWVADDVHAHGMAVFQKNDPDQASQLEPYFDGALDEQCNQYTECSSYEPYIQAGKPVLNAEYETSLYPAFCSSDNAAGIMGALYSMALDGSLYEPCFGPSTTTPITGAPPTSPTSPTGPKRELDQAAPKVGIGSGRLKTVGSIVSVKLSCPRRQSYCAGTLELATVERFALAPGPDHHPGRGPLALGSKRFHVNGGRSALVKLELSRKALRKLAGRRSISVLIEVADRDAAGLSARSRRTVKLELGGVSKGPHARARAS
jgi:hypothetical protein